MKSIYDYKSLIILNTVRIYPKAKVSWVATSKGQRDRVNALFTDYLITTMSGLELTPKGRKVLEDIMKNLSDYEKEQLDKDSLSQYKKGIDRIQSIVENKR